MLCALRRVLVHPAAALCCDTKPRWELWWRKNAGFPLARTRQGPRAPLSGYGRNDNGSALCVGMAAATYTFLSHRGAWLGRREMLSVLLPVAPAQPPSPVLLQVAAVHLPRSAAGLALHCGVPSADGAWAEPVVPVCWCCAVPALYTFRMLATLG